VDQEIEGRLKNGFVNYYKNQTMKPMINLRIPRWISLALLLLLLTMGNTAAPQKQRSMKYTSRSARMAEAWQTELRTKLVNVLKISDLLPTGKTIPLNVSEIRVENRSDYLLKEIEINATQDRRIRFLVTFPLLSRGPWPAVICLHGHDGTLTSVYQNDKPYHGFAEELAKKNYVTLAPMISYHDSTDKGQTIVGQRLWDVMRCVDYLESLVSVDSHRIGCAGYELGGEMAMWLGAMDLRIAAVVSAEFLTRMRQMEQNHCQCWKTDGLRELVDFSDIFCLIAPRPLLCQNGLKEPPTQFPVDIAKIALKDIQVAYSNFSKPDNISFVAHPEGQEVDVQSLLLFFKKELKPVGS